MLNKQKKINRRMKKAMETRKKNREAKINSTYLNKEWMFSRYCIDRILLEEIGKLCRVEYDVVYEALKKLGIPILLMVGREFWWNWVEENKLKIHYKGVK